jgi:hypothetical protein
VGSEAAEQVVLPASDHHEISIVIQSGLPHHFSYGSTVDADGELSTGSLLHCSNLVLRRTVEKSLERRVQIFFRAGFECRYCMYHNHVRPGLSCQSGSSS